MLSPRIRAFADKVLFTAGALILIAVIGLPSMSKNSKSPIKLGLSGSWKVLHPGLQHTLTGDLVLSNQFDPLVGFTPHGTLVPLAAASWETDKTSKVFTFRISQGLHFSDGSLLTSSDFKNSWEEALRLEPKSSNSSLLDLLYKLEGFDEFEKVGHISGIQTPTLTTLRLVFKSPFRMALDHLAGVRFAPFRKKGNDFIGTGRYIIRAVENHRIHLSPNPFHADFKQLSPVEDPEEIGRT